MVDYTLTDESIIVFHTLYRGEEEDGLIPVGRQDIASYVSLPVEALEVIDLLDSGKTVGKVREVLEKKYGEEVEIADFIEDMITNEMVKSVDGHEIPTTSKVQNGLFTGIRGGHVGWMFSPYAWVIYAGMAVFSLALFVVYPEYIPHPQDLFFHPWYSVAIIFLLFFSWMLVAIHELAHLFAAKAVGIEGNFSISNRLIFLVAQTNLGNIWIVPRRKRYIVYLAGIAWDGISIFICLILLLLSDKEVVFLPLIMYKFIKTLVFIKVWAVIWQFRFNMQTDIYYVISNFFKCGNLLNDAQTFIRNGISRVFPLIKRVNMSDTPEHELRAVRLYSIFYVVGTLVTLAMFLLRTLPIVLIQVVRAFNGLTAGYSRDSIAFTDAIVLIVLNVFRYSLLGYVAIKPRWGRIRQRFHGIL